MNIVTYPTGRRQLKLNNSERLTLQEAAAILNQVYATRFLAEEYLGDLARAIVALEDWNEAQGVFEMMPRRLRVVA